MRASYFTSIPLLLVILLSSCQPEIENFESESVADYLPLQPGKYITYRLDSTVFTGFGRTEEIHSFQEKQLVDAIVTDNMGRTSYRINRYLRDTAGTRPWTVSDVYFITPLEKSAEQVENNLRTIRLAVPIKQGFSWLGNNYLPIEPYNKTYSFSSSTNTQLDDWEYRYEAISETAVFNGKTFADVITITHIDEEYELENTTLQGKTFSMDRYAKGVGLVYQELIMWEQQPNSSGSPYKTGFGVRRSLLDHN